MATIVGTLFGFLGDLVGTHVFTDGTVPQALRRRWNLVGFNVTDDEANGWLTIEPIGGSDLVGDPDATVSADQDVIIGATRHILASAGDDLTIDAENDIKIGGNDAGSVEIGRVGITTNILGTLENNGVAIGTAATVNITDNESITGPGSIEISPAAGFNLDLLTTTGAGVARLAGPATGAVILHTTSTAPTENAGDVLVHAQGDVQIGGTQAASAIDIRAGGAPSTSVLPDGSIRVRGPGGINVASGATTVSHVTGAVKVQGDVGVSIGAGAADPATPASGQVLIASTSGTFLNTVPIRHFFAVRVISAANVANLASVTVVDGVTLADGDLVLLKDQSTTTQNGIYRFTLSTTTLARSAAFDALDEYHLGTTCQAYEGTNAGEQWYLSALSSSLPATWTQVPSGGSSTSISQSGGSVAVDGDGWIDAVSSDGASLALNTNIVLDVTGGDIEIGDTSSLVRVGDATTHVDVSATGDTVAIVAASGGNIAESVGSASRTVTASSTARTETYNGTLDYSTGGTCTIGSANAVALNAAGNIVADAQNVCYIQGVNGVTMAAGGSGDVIIYHRSVGEPRWIQRVQQVDTSTTDATLTTLRTLTPTTRPSTYTVIVHAYTASGAAAAYWRRTIRAVLRSGSAVIDGSNGESISAAVPDDDDSGGTLATCALTIDVSTTTVRIRGAGVAATNLTWAVNVTEMK